MSGARDKCASPVFCLALRRAAQSGTHLFGGSKFELEYELTRPPRKIGSEKSVPFSACRALEFSYMLSGDFPGGSCGFNNRPSTAIQCPLDRSEVSLL